VAGSGKTPRINFASGLLEGSDLKQPRRFVDFLISLATQAAFVLLLILPLRYTQAFNLPDLEKTILVAPPPPPPPRSELRVVARPKASLFDNGRLVAPRAIPKHVQILKEAPEESTGEGAPGGVLGGVPGGTLGEYSEESFPLEMRPFRRHPSL